MGFISQADDFVSFDDDEADRLWNDTGEALKEIGLKFDRPIQIVLYKTREDRMGPQNAIFQGEDCGTGN